MDPSAQIAREAADKAALMQQAFVGDVDDVDYCECGVLSSEMGLSVQSCDGWGSGGQCPMQHPAPAAARNCRCRTLRQSNASHRSYVYPVVQRVLYLLSVLLKSVAHLDYQGAFGSSGRRLRSTLLLQCDMLCDVNVCCIMRATNA